MQKCKIAKMQNCKNAKFQNFKISKFQNFRITISCCLEMSNFFFIQTLFQPMMGTSILQIKHLISLDVQLLKYFHQIVRVNWSMTFMGAISKKLPILLLYIIIINIILILLLLLFIIIIIIIIDYYYYYYYYSVYTNVFLMSYCYRYERNIIF
jgi:hypothetical protein